MPRNGRLVRTLFQHPDGKNDGDATYEIPLPALPQAEKLVLKFGTVISNRTQDGVRFSVLANGNELWSETKTAFIPPDQAATHVRSGQHPARPRSILRSRAGSVELRRADHPPDSAGQRAGEQLQRLGQLGGTESFRGAVRAGLNAPRRSSQMLYRSALVCAVLVGLLARQGWCDENLKTPYVMLAPATQPAAAAADMPVPRILVKPSDLPRFPADATLPRVVSSPDDQGIS